MQIFKNFRGEHAPRPPRVLLSLELLIFNSAGKKMRLKELTKFGAPFQKNSQCASDIKHFQRAYLGPIPGLNVLASLYLVNIQPNSKLHPLPRQNFLNPQLPVSQENFI